MVGKAGSARPVGRTLQRRKPLQLRGRWYSLIAGLLLASLAVSGDVSAPLNDAAAWREACKVSGYSCYRLRAPFVVKAPLIGIYGRYIMGEKYVLVDEGLTGPLAYAVRVHEMTHFLQWKHGKWKFNLLNSCEMEREAFGVSNAVLRRLGDTRDVVDWTVMRLQYGCP